jgi:hypothetical protein
VSEKIKAYAFPKGRSDYSDTRGMTMRQYYAAHSHIGLDDANLSLQQRNTMGVLEFGVAALIAEMVRLRLEYADTMIAAESAQ